MTVAGMTVPGATMAGMEIGDYLTTLHDRGMMLRDAADLAGFDAPVPTCPLWQVRDLVRHIGYVHRWATSYVTGESTDMTPELTEAEVLAGGPPDSELLDWYADGLSALIDALAGADPALRAWTFLPAPSPLVFWARRQAHETAIHCADAEQAAGLRQPAYAYPAQFAVDGIDELLVAFSAAGSTGSTGSTGSADPPAAGDPRGTRALLVRAADAGRHWRVRLGEDGSNVVTTALGPGEGDSAACTLTGPASGLYLLLWGRADPAAASVTVSGDDQVLHAWRDGMDLTWH
jgi:uncharacterized protein (TIGR03083 family)